MLTVQTADCHCAACQAQRRARRHTGVKSTMPRETTDAMLAAAADAVPTSCWHGAEACRLLWRAMFDAELKD